ncbi:MAG: hypothetical protein MUE87_00560 [Methanothrix sp.]|nr:hypothetical protein [Methanothrix sp.]
MIVLAIGVLKWDVLEPPIQHQNPSLVLSVGATNWGDWLMRMQSFLGIGTLLVALYVWYGKIRENWEDDLPKLMSVFFFHNGCWFSWNEIPDNKSDRDRLLKHLSHEFGIAWATEEKEKAKIEKTDDDKIIRVSRGEHHLSLRLNDEKTEALLEIDDCRSFKFKALTESGETNIYYRESCSRPAIVCRYVPLAGADDLRNWGQQVAAQAAYNERFLEFSPNIKTADPKLVVLQSDSRICKSYSMSFQLKKLPTTMINEPEICRYQSFAAKDIGVQSIPCQEVSKLRAVTEWQMLCMI